MQKKTETQYLSELWQIFERTGSIGAYILYNDAKKRAFLKGKESKMDQENRDAKA
jgi:hypothetical protein